MMKLSNLARVFGAALALAAAATAPAAPAKSGYVKANGLDYYYEIRGKGEPLLLLHGGLGSTAMFAPIMPALTDHRTVIAVDMHGHGRTALGTRKIDPVDIGRDLGLVLEKTGFGQVDVFGYSMGGFVALQLAAQHPQKVRRLVLVSAGYALDGFFPDMREQQKALGAQFAEGMKGTPMYESYVAVAPKPEDFPRLLQAMGDFMRGSADYSADVKKVTSPTMIVFGDSDMYRPEHVMDFYKLLGGGLRDAGWGRETMSKNRLAIIPDQTHYDIIDAPNLIATTLPFLDGVSGSRGPEKNGDAGK